MIGWFSPLRWLAVLGLLVTLAAGAKFVYEAVKDSGRDEVTALWTAEKLAVSEASRQREKALTLKTQEVDNAYQAAQTLRAASERATALRLRQYQAAAASAGSGAPKPSSGLDAAYRAIALECPAAITALDDHAQRVSAQAIALQEYAKLCVGPSP